MFNFGDERTHRWGRLKGRRFVAREAEAEYLQPSYDGRKHAIAAAVVALLVAVVVLIIVLMA